MGSCPHDSLRVQRDLHPDFFVSGMALAMIRARYSS